MTHDTTCIGMVKSTEAQIAPRQTIRVVGKTVGGAMNSSARY